MFRLPLRINTSNDWLVPPLRCAPDGVADDRDGPSALADADSDEDATKMLGATIGK